MNKLSRMMLATMVLGGVKGPSVSGDFVEEGTRKEGKPRGPRSHEEG
jgi:hypothetical protein